MKFTGTEYMTHEAAVNAVAVMSAEIDRLRAQLAKLTEAALDVWNTVPAEHSGSAAFAHAQMLARLRAVLDEFTQQEESK